MSVRPYKREQRRCPVCGRACDFYDMANRVPQAVEGDGPGALGLLPGVRALQGALPGARRAHRGRPLGAARGALHARLRGLGGVAGGPLHRLGGLELARVEWHSVGGACRRVYAELEAARGASRFDGVRRIGIDETSYKKGHKYVTVVVDHDRGCLVWAHEGTGKDVLNLSLDGLAREQRRAMEAVAADGARRIGQLAKRRCPNARVMDPFSVVQWMNDAPDAVRCEEWNAAGAAAGPQAQARGQARQACQRRAAARGGQGARGGGGPPSRAAATRS